MKFIHTADLHIDQPFSGINSDRSEIKNTLKEANQNVLKKIVDQCIEKEVDFLLIVGDTFHQNQPTIHTQKLVMEEFQRLAERGIKVVLSFGNHDYYSENRYWFEWPDNVLLFSKEEVQTKSIQLKNGDSVSISGFSYEHQWIERSMIPDFPKRQTESTFHIGFYHGDNTSNYAPFSYSDLPHSYEYWALGHIHKSEVVSERPFAVYPGTPQGHTKKDYQTKGVVYVDITRSGRQIEWLDVATVSWSQKKLVLKEELLKQALLQQIETFILDDTYDYLLNVVTLRIETTGENIKELLKEKEEIILYLQELLYKATNQKVWLKDIHFSQNGLEQLIMGFETSLIDDLSRVYQSNENFEKVMSDLTKQSGIAQNLVWETEDIAELVAESSQLIKDKMIFKNEEER